VHSHVNTPLKKGGIKLPGKETLPARRIKGLVQEQIPGGLHGNNFCFDLVVTVMEKIRGYFSLYDRKTAFAAADSYIHCVKFSRLAG
jgi:hypothetical protein